MTVRLTIITSDNVYYGDNDVLSFRFDKDIYTPYTTLTARIRLSREISNASEVMLTVNGFTVHYGLLDSTRSMTLPKNPAGLRRMRSPSTSAAALSGACTRR